MPGPAPGLTNDPAHPSQVPARTRGPAGDPMFRATVLGGAGLLALGLFWLQFCPSVDLPDKPPRPATETLASNDLAGVARAAEANPITYAGFIERDSERFLLDTPATVESMGARFAYRSDDTVRSLELDETIEVAGLELTLSAEPIEDSREKLLVLAIENPGASHVAFNVVTRPMTRSRLCKDPPGTLHNAMALPPGGRVERTECLYHRSLKISLRRVEVMELSPLSYHYVSRVPPEAAGVTPRLAANHKPPMGRTCRIMLPAQLRAELENGEVGWRDVIDYYARHRCDTYRFPEDYRAFEQDGARPLPVVDE